MWCSDKLYINCVTTRFNYDFTAIWFFLLHVCITVTWFLKLLIFAKTVLPCCIDSLIGTWKSLGPPTGCRRVECFFLQLHGEMCISFYQSIPSNRRVLRTPSADIRLLHTSFVTRSGSFRIASSLLCITHSVHVAAFSSTPSRDLYFQIMKYPRMIFSQSSYAFLQSLFA